MLAISFEEERALDYCYGWAAAKAPVSPTVSFKVTQSIWPELGGAFHGILVVNLFRRFPLSRVAYRVLDCDESNPPSFCALAFIASYQVRTKLRAIARCNQSQLS